MQNLEFKKTPRIFYLQGVFFIAVLIFIDQLAKKFAQHFFYNRQFAFSLPLPTGLVYLIYVLVLAGIIYYLFSHKRPFLQLEILAWLLITAGAFSNIGERIIFGHVRDFIYISFYKWTGIYNLADFYIIVGVVLLILEPKTSKFLKR